MIRWLQTIFIIRLENMSILGFKFNLLWRESYETIGRFYVKMLIINIDYKNINNYHKTSMCGFQMLKYILVLLIKNMSAF